MDNYFTLKPIYFPQKRVHYRYLILLVYLFFIYTFTHACPLGNNVKTAYNTIGYTTSATTQIEFRVQKTARGNILHWRTTSDRNSHYFEIERSIDNISFKSIAAIDGTQTIQPFNSYSFADTSHFREGIYYRLKQIAPDGEYTYSRIISVQGTYKTFIELPSHPCTEELNIQFYNPSQPEVKVNMWNAKGQLVRVLEYTLVQDQLRISVKDLPAGVYTIHILNANYRYVDRIIKL